MNKTIIAAGVESGAILVAMIGTFFFDDLPMTEGILAVALAISIGRYTRGGE